MSKLLQFIAVVVILVGIVLLAILVVDPSPVSMPGIDLIRHLFGI